MYSRQEKKNSEELLPTPATSKVGPYYDDYEIISIFHGCTVWIEKSVTRVTDRHHEACLVMPNSDPE